MRRLLALTVVFLSVLTVALMSTGERGPTAAAAGPDPVGTVYVANANANSIDVFAAGTNGNIAPIRTISGPSTGINYNGDVAVDSSGDLYSSNFNGYSITEYAPGASGNVAPICTIQGSSTGLATNDDISLASDGTLYVGNFYGNYPVEVFAPGACGNVAPLRVIAGSLTGLSLVDGLGFDATGTLYGRIWGDGDCSGAVSPVDALKVLQTDAGYTVPQTVAGCPALGSNVTVATGPRGEYLNTWAWGDVDCKNGLGPPDALKILETDAGYTVPQTVTGCPALGSTVVIFVGDNSALS